MLAIIQFKIVSSHLLSKNVKINISKTVNFTLILYGCGTWSLALREEHRLRAFEDKVSRRMLRPKEEEVPGAKKSCIMRSLQFVLITKCQGV
jgi:hypothetical protein